MMTTEPDPVVDRFWSNLTAPLSKARAEARACLDSQIRNIFFS
jgi:hypothetical protein